MDNFHAKFIAHCFVVIVHVFMHRRLPVTMNAIKRSKNREIKNQIRTCQNL